ncbi:hypothetical protein MPER_11860 [Moniliophthora perniciosa FA553]|nr:hypothetical protein MPER_11860 [Moniliophthora perniciosa FA553]
MDFNPDRFLANHDRQPEPDPRELCFGFGRRYASTFLGSAFKIETSRCVLSESICPGMHLADASVFVSCAMSLAVFDITKCVENGVAIEPVNDRTTGTISHPKPFKCSIKPRSPKAVALIQSEETAI